MNPSKNIVFGNYILWIIFLGLAVILSGKAESIESWSVDKRFMDNGDKTITDTKTGLMWMKEDSYLHSGHWVNWFKSIQFIKQMNKEGFANEYDWRLPTIDQLTTLYEMDKMNSKVLGKGMNIHIDPIFAKEGSGSIWSVDENGNHNAFGLVFNTGKRFNSSKNSTFRKAVRAVRYLN